MSNCNKYIRFDWAIKHILRDKANFEVLEGFISVFLDEKVKIVEILESEGNQEHATDKFNRVDIKARNDKGHIIIVEVQLTRQLHFIQRLLYGVSKTVTENIKLGESYDKVPKVYSISILYCDMGEGKDYLYRGLTSFVGVNTQDRLRIKTRDNDSVLTAYPESILPEYFLIRVNNFDQIPVTAMEEWMDYLKTGTIKEGTTTPGLREASEKLKCMNMTVAEKIAYDRHMDSIMVENDTFTTALLEGRAEGRAEGLEEGRAEGLEEGRAEEKIAMIRSMRDNGLDAEMIARISNCAVSYVREVLGD